MRHDFTTSAFAIGSVLLLSGLLSGCSAKRKNDAYLLTGGEPDRGKIVIRQYGCASCHTIPGIRGADALVGPPLTRMGGRVYIGGVLKNTPDNLIRWLQNPPGVDPLTAMPNLRLTDSEARDVASYLYTLK